MLGPCFWRISAALPPVIGAPCHELALAGRRMRRRIAVSHDENVFYYDDQFILTDMPPGAI
jgi:hypothetical protein